MLILAVELENVKSYDNAKVEFQTGVNAIVGHNGAGKSTLLEAIGFVLFDYLEYKQDEFIRAGAKSATAVVTFVSSEDDRAYQVTRRIGSGAQYHVYDAELDTRICEGKADVQRFLRRHLGVDEGSDLAAIFRDAVGVPQGMLAATFRENASARANVFDVLLKVRDYESVWAKLRDSVAWLKDQRSQLNTEIAGMEARLEPLAAMKLAVAELATSLDAAQRDLLAAAAELVAVQQQRGELEAVRAELGEREAQIAQAALRQTELQTRLDAAQRQLAEAETAARMVAEHQADAERYRAAEVEQKELDQRLRRRRQADAARTEADKVVALIESQARSAEKQLQEIDQAEAEMATLAPAVAEQAALEDALAQARQQQARLDDARRVAEQAAAQVVRLQRSLAELEQNHGRVAAVEAARAEAEECVAALRIQIDKCREEMGLYKSQAESLKEQTARLEDIQTAVCPVCEQPLTDTHRLDLLKRNAEQVQAMREKYKAAKSAVQEHEAAQGAQEQQIKALQAELLHLPRTQEVEKGRADLARAQESDAAARAQVEQLSAAPGQVEALAKQLAALDDPRRRHAVAAEKAARRSGLVEQQADLAQRLQQARAALDAATATLEEFAGLDERMDAVAADLARYQPAAQAVLMNTQQAATLPARQTEVAALSADLERESAEVARLDAERNAVAQRFDEPRYSTLTARSDALQSQIGGLRTEIDHLQADQARNQAEIAALEVVETALAAKLAQRRKLDDQEAVLEMIRTLLRQAGPKMRAALIRQISDGAHQIFGEIMQDFSRRLAWNEDYSVSLEVDGHARQFLQLSGGEQMTAALAIRLALLREMSRIDVAFFDEPTANLDETRREALARQILAVRGFSQIFVISHDDTFEQATQNLVRVQRIDGVSRVVTDTSMA